LESRRLLAASLSGSVLVITGTNGDDDIAVSQRKAITVSFNGKETTYKASRVSRIRIDGRNGDDTIDLRDGVSRRATVLGGGGNDRIYGGSNADSLSGGDGNDRIFGLGGADFIDGGNGRDKLSGGSSDDQIYGGAGDDKLNGGNGNDTLGGDNEDLLNFWKSPYAAPTPGNDLLDGGAGNDWLLGSKETNEDQYDDDAAAKLIATNNGRDTLIGGVGNDILDARGDDSAPDMSAGDIDPDDTYHNNGLPIPDHGEDEDPYHFHGHIVLRVIVDGKKVEFPVGTGEFGVTMIHRHYADDGGSVGTDRHKDSWHLHALAPHTFTLKQIFHTAGVSFSNKNIGRHVVANGAKMTMRVKFTDEPDSAFRAVTGNFADYVIKSTDIDSTHRQEVIEIRYASK
jgi:Ca2+-binding RTX toxin-like protein